MISNVLLLGGGTNTKLGNNPVSSSSDGPSVSTVVQNTAGATAQTGGILEKVISFIVSWHRRMTFIIINKYIHKH